MKYITVLGLCFKDEIPRFVVTDSVKVMIYIRGDNHEIPGVDTGEYTNNFQIYL